MINLLDFNLEELTNFVTSLNEPKFRAKQLQTDILGGKDFSDSTVLPKAFLDKVSSAGAKFQAVTIYKTFKSKDKTIKFLFKLNDNNLIEGVLMQYKFGKTLCVSTQVGCKMNCAFCASGLNFVRNLSAGEILGQITAVNAYLKGTVKDRAITNIVLMGSGEPLDNFDNVTKFLKLVTSEEGLNFSVRNITVSTCGLVPKIEKLADLGINVTLAISLHAPNNKIRLKLMPVSKSYSIESVIEAAKYYYTLSNRRVIIEYALINGVNDSMECARELSHMLENLTCHVNLIRLNDVAERGLVGSTENRMNLFLRELLINGTSATIRRSLGDDIDGACGQLRNKELTEQNKVKNVKTTAVISNDIQTKQKNKTEKLFNKTNSKTKFDSNNKNKGFSKNSSKPNDGKFDKKQSKPEFNKFDKSPREQNNKKFDKSNFKKSDKKFKNGTNKNGGVSVKQTRSAAFSKITKISSSKKNFR